MFDRLSDWEIRLTLKSIADLERKYNKTVLTDFNAASNDPNAIKNWCQQAKDFLKKPGLNTTEDFTFYTSVANAIEYDFEKDDLIFHYIARAMIRSNDVKFIHLITNQPRFYQLFSDEQKKVLKEHIQKLSGEKKSGLQIVKQNIFSPPAGFKLPDMLYHHDQFLKDEKVTPYQLFGFDEKQPLTREQIIKEYEERVRNEAPIAPADKEELLVVSDHLKLLQVARDVLLYIRNHPEKKQDLECLKQGGPRPK